MSNARDPSVRVRIPPEFKLGAQGIADRCGWKLRVTSDPEQFEVAVRARIEGRADKLVAAKRAIGAGGADLIGWENSFVWTGQDIYVQLVLPMPERIGWPAGEDSERLASFLEDFQGLLREERIGRVAILLPQRTRRPVPPISS
jgi:hypothetical protein